MDRPLDCVMVGNSVSGASHNFFLFSHLRASIFSSSRFPSRLRIALDVTTNQEYFICDALLEKLT